jgi:hypothetical protein
MNSLLLQLFSQLAGSHKRSLPCVHHHACNLFAYFTIPNGALVCVLIYTVMHNLWKRHGLPDC